MNDKSPSKSLIKRLEATIKTIEDDSRKGGKNYLTPSGLAVLGRASRLLTKALGRKGELAKGGIVKKNKGGLMVKPKAAKRGY